MTPAGTHTLHALLAEAAEWRLIALLLERPRAGWHREVAALAAEVSNPALRAAAHAANAATEGEYLQVVGPGGLVSPREVTYRTFEDPGRVLATLSAAYAAFAYQPRVEDPLDHLAVEAGFVGYLFLKEAFATECGDDEAASTTAAAREGFLEAHLTVGHPFAARFAAAGGTYLASVAQVLAARVPEHLAPVGPGAGDTMLACGTCG